MPQAYRVAFYSTEHYYLELTQRGAIVSPPLGEKLSGGRVCGLGKESDFTLVDINGGKIQFGDPIHIKHGKHYVAAGPPPDQRVQLVATSTPAARWTIHAFNPNADPDGAYGSVQKGLANVLIRSSTGDFLIPCARDICKSPPPHSGVRAAGSRDDVPPWWVKDPRFSDIDDDDPGWFRQSVWSVTAIADCDYTVPVINKKSKRVCTATIDD